MQNKNSHQKLCHAVADIITEVNIKTCMHMLFSHELTPFCKISSVHKLQQQLHNNLNNDAMMWLTGNNVSSSDSARFVKQLLIFCL